MTEKLGYVLIDHYLPAFGRFLVFCVFHSLAAQENFKNCLKFFFGHFFEKYFWRIFYVLISLKLHFTNFIYYLNNSFPQGRTPFFYYEEGTLTLLSILSGTAILTFYISLLQIDFLSYFGLRQIFEGMKLVGQKILWKSEKNDGDKMEDPGLVTRGLYQFVRHPIYLSLLLMLIFSPLSGNSLFFIFCYISYLAVGIPLEERRLERQFGQPYRDYKNKTPAIIPNFPLKGIFVNFYGCLRRVYNGHNK